MTYWTETRIIQAAKYCASKYELQHTNRKAYDAARNRFPHLLDQLFPIRKQAYLYQLSFSFDPTVRYFSFAYSNKTIERALKQFPKSFDSEISVDHIWQVDVDPRTLFRKIQNIGTPAGYCGRNIVRYSDFELSLVTALIEQHKIKEFALFEI